MSDKMCWLCVHRPMCKYWASATEIHFPFASDDKIKPYTEAIALAMAQACAWYMPREQAPKV